MPLPAGQLTELVAFSAIAEGEDEYGEENGAWARLGSTRADVIWGSGGEQRTAAAQGGRQAATFRCRSTALTRAVTLKNRLTHKGVDWDIEGKVGRDRYTVDFNCVRSV